MKTKTIAATPLLIALLASPLVHAAGDHDHEHGHSHGKKDAHQHEKHVTSGPNGGHVVASKAGFAFEVTVDKERKARIVFLDKDNKAVALAGQSINGIAGARSAPTKLAFAQGKDADANVLIADKPLPAGDHVPMILTIQSTPDAKAVVERFELHLH